MLEEDRVRLREQTRLVEEAVLRRQQGDKPSRPDRGATVRVPQTCGDGREMGCSDVAYPPPSRRAD
jgi:hypothetical protein